MNKLLILTTVLFVGCNTATHDPVPKAVSNHSDTIPLLLEAPKTQTLIPLTAWDDLGKPLFDVDANADMFYQEDATTFEISEKLKTQAEEFLYPLSQRDYISIYQDLLHYKKTSANEVEHWEQRVMHDEFLYTRQQAFHVQVNYRGLGTVVKTPKHNGYTFDFITTFTSNPSDSFYQINAFFFEKERYGNPKKWDDWYGIVTQGHIMCCAEPTALATYHKTDSSLYRSYSQILKFPYFKRTEVLKEIKNDYVSRVDSSIFILKFGIYREAGYCDVRRFINGRLINNYWQKRLRRKLRY